MMSGLDVNMPVTLVVKAPNQKIADQTVECALGWTIRKLKEHLSSIYPNKPEQHQQKLIYSGKLLKDHLMLKDVLRQYDESTTHTLHLVCSVAMNNGSESFTTISQDSNSTSNIPVCEATSSATTTTTPVNTDGLRQRDTQAQRESTPQPTTSTHPYAAASASQFYGATSNPMAMPQYTQMNAFSPYGGAMNPQQLYWMQQMYAQQMTQYMQMHYMQQGMQPTPVSQAMPNAQQPAVPPVNQPVNNAPANNRPQANPNIVMNAQGGAMLDDEEEGNQDWLDWFYTLCRIGVLMSIVYFYSSISRAILGFGFFLLMYLYQIGWFRLQRRNIEQRQPVQPAPAPPAQQPDQQQENNEPERNNVNENGPEENDGVNDGDSDSSATTDGQAVPQEPQTPQPNVLELTWTFLKTFFTSLMPAQPPIVNAN